MPYELSLAIVLIGTLSVLAFLAGRRLGSSTAKNRGWLLAESACFSMLFAWTLADRLLWAQAIPISNVVCWANLTPIFVAFTAGLASQTTEMGWATRPIATVALSLLAVTHLFQPVARPALWPIESLSTPQWDRGVCLQTHSSTCAAAAAVTLLSNHDITTSELEMTGACLTSTHGTTPLGLYRGVSVAAKNHQMVARVANRDPMRWATNNQLPNIALVRFGPDDGGQTRSFLGPTGEGHAVVVLGKDDGGWLVGDPAVGLVRWSEDELRRRFIGDAVYLD